MEECISAFSNRNIKMTYLREKVKYEIQFGTQRMLNINVLTLCNVVLSDTQETQVHICCYCRTQTWICHVYFADVKLKLPCFLALDLKHYFLTSWILHLLQLEKLNTGSSAHPQNSKQILQNPPCWWQSSYAKYCYRTQCRT